MLHRRARPGQGPHASRVHHAVPRPWCGGADVQWQNEHGMQATVQIRFAGIRQSFTTRNDHSYPHRIVFHLVDGPFSSLTGDWDFQALGEDGCKVVYTMEYAFSSRAMSAVIGPRTHEAMMRAMAPTSAPAALAAATRASARSEKDIR